MLKVELLKNIAPKVEQSRKNGEVVDRASSDLSFKGVLKEMKENKSKPDKSIDKKDSVEDSKMDKKDMVKEKGSSPHKLKDKKYKENNEMKSKHNGKKIKELTKAKENQAGEVILAALAIDKKVLSGEKNNPAKDNSEIEVVKKKKNIGEVSDKKHSKLRVVFVEPKDVKKGEHSEDKRDVSPHKLINESGGVEKKKARVFKKKEAEAIEKNIKTEELKKGGKNKSGSKTKGIGERIEKLGEHVKEVNNRTKKKVELVSIENNKSYKDKNGERQVEDIAKRDLKITKHQNFKNATQLNSNKGKEKPILHEGKDSVSKPDVKVNQDGSSSSNHKIESELEEIAKNQNFTNSNQLNSNKGKEKLSIKALKDGAYHLERDGKKELDNDKKGSSHLDSKAAKNNVDNTVPNNKNNQDSTIQNGEDKFLQLSKVNISNGENKELKPVKSVHRLDKGSLKPDGVGNVALDSEEHKNYKNLRKVKVDIVENEGSGKKHNVGIKALDYKFNQEDKKLSDGDVIKNIKKAKDSRLDKKGDGIEANESAQSSALNRQNVKINTVSQANNLNPPLDKVIEHIDKLLNLRPPLTKSILVKMEPPYIGVIHLKVSIDSQKNLSATLAVHDKDTYKAVITHLNSLKDYLQSNGFRVQNIDVHNSFNENFLNQFSSGSGGFQQNSYTPQNSGQPTFEFFKGDSQVDIKNELRSTKVIDGVDLIV